MINTLETRLNGAQGTQITTHEHNFIAHLHVPFRSAKMSVVSKAAKHRSSEEASGSNAMKKRVLSSHYC